MDESVPALKWEVINALTAIGGDEVIDAFIGLLKPDSWAVKGEGLPPPAGPPPIWWPDGRVCIIAALNTLNAKKAENAVLGVLSEKGIECAYLEHIILPFLAKHGSIQSIPILNKIANANPMVIISASTHIGKRQIQQRAAETSKAISKRSS